MQFTIYKLCHESQRLPLNIVTLSTRQYGVLLTVHRNYSNLVGNLRIDTCAKKLQERTS